MESQREEILLKSVLSKKIKRVRKDKGITLQQLAKEVGSSKSYMWQLENSSDINPSAQLISKIAEALGTTVDYLLGPNQEDMTVDDEISVFFRDFKKLNANTQKGLMAQVEALKKLQKKDD